MDSTSKQSGWLWGGRSPPAIPSLPTNIETDGQLSPPKPSLDTASTSSLLTPPERSSEDNGGFHAKTLGGLAGISRLLAPSLSSRLNDKRLGVLGRDALCSQCSQFPIAEFRSSERQLGELKWRTTLERLLQQPWCRLCRLLLHMLSRPENDLLSNRKVAQHVPDAIKGWPLSKFAEQDWSFIEAQWPFGRTAKREKASAPTPMDDTDAADDNAAIPAETCIQKVVPENNAKPQQLRYRKDCSLVVTLHKSKNAEHSPGHLAVKCWGYTGDPQSEQSILGRFHLRVADDRVSSSPPLGTVRYGRKVDPEWIELRTARQWVAECMENHRDSCDKHGWEAARRAPEYLRVVDVQERCITSFNSPTVPYVALSYMWGGVEGLLLTRSNMEALQEPGALTSLINEIPRTIVDAMEVVKAMGQRYLWVDALVSLKNKDSSSRI